MDFEKAGKYFGLSGERKILWVLWSEENVIDFEKSEKYFGLGVRKKLCVLWSEENVMDF